MRLFKTTSILITLLVALTFSNSFADTITLASNLGVTAFDPLPPDGSVPPDHNSLNWVQGTTLIVAPVTGWATLSGAEWISTADNSLYPDVSTYRKFEISFNLPDDNYTGSLLIAADNAVNPFLNGTHLGTWSSYSSLGGYYDIGQYLIPGLNLFQFRVTNTWNGALTTAGNPTGLLFKAEISSAPVPEPATMILFGAGLLGLAGVGIRRKKKQI